VEGLVLGGHLGGEAGDDGIHFERVCALHQRGEDVAGGNHEQRDFLAEALGNGDGLGEDHLLVLAEALVFGALRYSGPPAPIMRTLMTTTSCSSVLVRERVHLSAKGLDGVAHGDHDAAGADGRRLAADGVLVLELEVVLHLPRGDGVLLAQVLRARRW
jgi:hypothetical protein